MWLAWLLAIGTTGYFMWKISGTSVRVLWIIPGVIWDDWRHQPQVLCSPLSKRPNSGFWWWVSLVVCFAFWLAWLLWLSGVASLGWVLLAELLYLFLVLTGNNGIYPAPVLKNLHCRTPEEQSAWLTLFERQYPQLAALSPSVLYPQLLPTKMIFSTVILVLASISPLLLQFALSVNITTALIVISFIVLSIITSVPLIRWAGMIVGGRYTAWIAYHTLIDAQTS